MKTRNFFRKTILPILLVTFLQTGCKAQTFERMVDGLLSFSVPTIKPDQLDSLRKVNPNLLIIDNRTEAEYKVSHIPGAVFLPYGTDPSQLSHGSPEKEKEIVVYCSVGYRSEKTGEKLQALGFKHVKNLYGGIFLWNNLSYPLTDMNGKTTDHIHPYDKNWGKWITKGVKVER